jgi:hypothetical protein
MAGFEPTAPRSQSECATKLRHIPSRSARKSRRSTDDRHNHSSGMPCGWRTPAPSTLAAVRGDPARGRSSMAESQSSKLMVRVRFPSPAPHLHCRSRAVSGGLIVYCSPRRRLGGPSAPYEDACWLGCRCVGRHCRLRRVGSCPLRACRAFRRAGFVGRLLPTFGFYVVYFGTLLVTGLLITAVLGPNVAAKLSVVRK